MLPDATTLARRQAILDVLRGGPLPQGAVVALTAEEDTERYTHARLVEIELDTLRGEGLIAREWRDGVAYWHLASEARWPEVVAKVAGGLLLVLFLAACAIPSVALLVVDVVGFVLLVLVMRSRGRRRKVRVVRRSDQANQEQRIGEDFANQNGRR